MRSITYMYSPGDLVFYTTRIWILLQIVFLGPPNQAFVYHRGFSDALIGRVYEDMAVCYNNASCLNVTVSCGLPLALPPLLSGIITKTSITTIVIIYDRQTHMSGGGVLSSLALTERVAIEEYFMDSCSTSEVQDVLDADCEPEGEAKLHILACNPTCIKEFLYQINIHDRRYDEQGVFTYRDRWLLLTDIDIAYFHPHIGNITHILAITQEFNGTIYDGTCAVMSGMWLPEGHQFVHVGHIQDGQLSLHSPAFPNEEFGFNGRKFTCTTNIWFQYVKKHDNNTFTGVTFDLLTLLEPSLNFSCETREPKDLAWGVIVDGSWNGIVGELARKDVDIAAAPLGRTFQRAQVMDFSAAFATSYYAVMYHRTTSSYSTKIDLFLRPFHWKVWLSTCGSVLVAGLCLWGVGYLTVYLGINSPPNPRNQNLSPRKHRHQKQGRSKHSQDPYYIKSHNNLWFTFGTVILQSSVERPSAVPVRCLVGAWWFFAVILMATYTGNLTAVLAVEKYYPPFRTLEELAVHPNYKIGTVGSTIIVPAMQTATSGIYSRMWKKVEANLDKDPDVLNNNHEVHVEKTKTETYAYFTELDGLSLEVSKNCSLTIMDDFFYPAFFSYGFHNNSAYKKPFDMAIYKLREAGLLDKWMIDHTPEAQCNNEGDSRNISLSFEDSQGIFLLLSVCLLISLVVLGVEQFFEKLKDSCRTSWDKSMISIPDIFNNQIHHNASLRTIENPPVGV